jgi:hypothetical protein
LPARPFQADAADNAAEPEQGRLGSAVSRRPRQGREHAVAPARSTFGRRHHPPRGERSGQKHCPRSHESGAARLSEVT